MLWPAPQLTQKPDCPKAKQMTWQARRALERGETEAALSLSHAALGLYDRTTNADGRHHAATLVGDTLMAMGQTAQAVDYYRRALEIDPCVARAGGLVKLADAYQASGHLNDAYRAFADAQRLYTRLGQTDQATHHLTEAERLYEMLDVAEATWTRAALDGLSLTSMT